MTDFNNIGRANQQAQQGQQFYDEQRYESMRGQGAAIERAGQSVSQDIWRGRQFEMQQQQAAQQQMALQQELARQQTETDMKLQAHQQDMAVMREKLMAMQAIDQTDGQRASVKMAQASARMAEIQAKQAEKDFADKEGNEARDWEAKRFKTMYPDGPRSVYEAGYVMDDPNGFKTRLPKDDAERDAFGKRIDLSRDHAAGGDPNNQRRIYLMNMLRAAEDNGDYATKEMAFNELKKIDPAFAAQVSKGDGAKSFENKLSPSDQTAVDDLAKRLSSSDGLVPGMVDGLAGGAGIGGVTVNRLPPEKAQAAAHAIVTNRKAILEGVRSGGGDRKVGQSDDEILGELSAALTSPTQSDKKFRMLAFLVSRGVLQPAEANRVWGGGQ